MAEIPNDIFMPETQERKNDQTIVIITGNDVEDIEFFYPYYRFIEAAYKVDVATPRGGEFKGKRGMGLKQSRSVADIDPADYRLLYLPGGKAPEQLKQDENVLDFVRAYAASDKLIAALCHGPQILAAANCIKGVRIAAWPEVEVEVRQAGAEYVNEETCIDGKFITGRWPADLPSHMKQVLLALEQQVQTGRLRSKVSAR